MNITDMINQWSMGCSCSTANPVECKECTLALIKAIYIKSHKDETMEECKKIIGSNGLAGMAMAASLALNSAEALSERLKRFKLRLVIKGSKND